MKMTTLFVIFPVFKPIPRPPEKNRTSFPSWCWWLSWLQACNCFSSPLIVEMPFYAGAGAEMLTTKPDKHLEFNYPLKTHAHCIAIRCKLSLRANIKTSVMKRSNNIY